MTFLDHLLADVRIAARGLRRSPGFAAAAVVTLALGIGATAAIFSVARAVLFKPLPYRDASQRVMIWSQWKGWDKTWVSEAELFDYRTRCRTLAEVGAWDSAQVNLTGAGDPLRVGIGRVTANLFQALGVAPALGRGFSAEEDSPGRNSVAVLSYGLWQRLYAADPHVVGRTLSLDGKPHTVVGVMPARFQLPTDFGEDAAQPTELWVPLAINPAEVERGSHGLYAAALLAPGATPAEATSELRALTTSLTREGLYPADMQFRAFAVSLEDEITGNVRPAVWLLLGAAGFLLLIACANVANLMLARSETRQREVAVRAALGAGGLRLARHVLSEALLLASLGAALGLLLALGATRAFASLGPVNIPRAGTISLDLSVLALTALLALGATVAFGAVPALRVLHITPLEALRASGTRTTGSGTRRRMRSGLVAAEMALAVVLVVGAGLMVRSLQSLHAVDLGFRPQRVLTARLWLPEASYQTPGQVVAFYGEFLRRVRTLPGVQAAGLVRSLPLGATIGDWGLDIEGLAARVDSRPKGDWQVATDGAFEALGERLVRGRVFDAGDRADSLQVAVVNETMARTYWPGRDALGQRIRLGRGRTDKPWVTVVGVVADERHNGITSIVKEKFYRPLSQFHLSTDNTVRGMTLVVRSAGDEMQLAAPIRDILRDLDASLPLAGVRRMEDVVAASMATPRATGALLTWFALLALSLAGIGIYGVLSYVVNERRREIGVRVAIGATSTQVMRLVLRNGLALSGVGLVLGLAAAAGLARLMAGLLHGVRPLDPLTFAAVPAVLALVAGVSSYLPARRAAHVDPVAALKGD